MTVGLAGNVFIVKFKDGHSERIEQTPFADVQFELKHSTPVMKALVERWSSLLYWLAWRSKYDDAPDEEFYAWVKTLADLELEGGPGVKAGGEPDPLDQTAKPGD